MYGSHLLLSIQCCSCAVMKEKKFVCGIDIVKAARIYLRKLGKMMIKDKSGIDYCCKEEYYKHMNNCSYVQKYIFRRNIHMKKKFKMVDLDCANCAAKMEAAIKKLDGVNDATVSFMMQKLTIDADDARFEEIMQEVVKVCKKVEPDCEILLS